MLFLADMGISPVTLAVLRETGHDAVHVRDYGMQRASDAAILARARDEGRILLTADLDFGYLMAISKATLPSIVLFRLSDMRPSSVSRHLTQVINNHSQALGSGAFVVVTDTATRVRRLPISNSR